MIYGHIMRRDIVKPHIRKRYGLWVCQRGEEKTEGSGNTWQEAYAKWIENKARAVQMLEAV
jgi:hypothetical protein